MTRPERRAAVVVLGSLLGAAVLAAAIVLGGGLRKSDWDVARSQVDTREQWQRDLDR